MQVSVKSSDFKESKLFIITWYLQLAWSGPGNLAWLLKELYILLVGFKIKLRFHFIKSKQLIF